MPLTIAIDGTAGAGKGYISDELAKILNITHLDTGAIYRTVAYACKKYCIDPKNEKEVESLLKKCKIEVILDGQKQTNMLDGENLGQKIRTAEISDYASVVSTYFAVREFATNMQHALADKYDIIIEGRDIGTVVLPNAKFKFYVDATPEERAKRRMLQNNSPESEYESILSAIIERDERDKTRKISPLKKADDAIYIDTTHLTREEVVNLILSYIKKWAFKPTFFKDNFLNFEYFFPVNLEVFCIKQ